MRLPGFCGPSYQSQSPNIDFERAMNCYCEKSESQGAITPIALLRTPGLKLLCTLPESGVPYLFTVNGRTFAAASNLYELTGGGTQFTNLGSLGIVPVMPTQITANKFQLLILNNGALFVLTLATNVLAAVTMGQFNGPVSQIGFADGYFIATIQNSNTFQVSNLEDGTTWGGLNISTISLFPDNITSFISDHRELWFFSGKKTAIYYNAGAGFPPFIPIQGAFLEYGCGAAFATVQLDNSVFWLDQDERGYMVALRGQGYSATRVSTHAVEFAWQNYSVTSDAVAYPYQDQGHTFWVIRFPTANKTWVYDVATQLWHERGFWNSGAGTYSAHRSTSHTLNFGIHLVGDWASGNIYQMSTQVYQDFGNTIRGERITPTLAKENQWIYFPEVEFDLETGLEAQPPLQDGNGQPRPAELMLEWSDNAGKTWSNLYILSVGLPGEYGKRVRKRMLGRARKRVWRISWTDPYPYAFADAYGRATPQVEQA